MEVSKAEVARYLGVTGVAVGLWENGTNEPSRDTLERLAAFYGVELMWLAFGRGPQWPPASSDIPIIDRGRHQGTPVPDEYQPRRARKKRRPDRSA